MKSRATGPSVRFFSVTIPTGTRASGSSTGRTLTSGCLAGNRKAEAGKIDVTLAQLPMQCLRLPGHDAKHDAGKAPGQPIDNRGHEARGQNVVASDPHVAGLGVGQEFDVLHALPQLVEDSDAALEQRSAVARRLSAVAVAPAPAHPQPRLEVGGRL